MKVVLIKSDGTEVVHEAVKGIVGDPNQRIIEFDNEDVIILKNLKNEVGFTNEKTGENFTKIKMISEERKTY